MFINYILNITGTNIKCRLLHSIKVHVHRFGTYRIKKMIQYTCNQKKNETTKSLLQLPTFGVDIYHQGDSLGKVWKIFWYLQIIY